MRIKTGMMVEAWITDDPTTMGAWRAGEVIWGNGHSYIMKWFDGGPDSARISRKFVRPIPDPDVQVPDDLAAGDIVELFDSGLWKWVEVVRVGDRHLDVKFVGSTKVLMADRSILRPRLLYGQDGWVVVHKNDKIPIRSAVPSRPIAGKNIKSKAIGNGGSNFAAHAVKLGKTKRSDYMVHADIVRDVKRFQGNNDTNRVFAKPKREEPAARYNDNTEVMDVHPSHCYLKKRQETGNNLDRLLAPRTESDKDDDVSSKSETSSSSGDSSSTSSSSSSSGSNSKGSDHIVSSGNGAVFPTLEHCEENQEAEIQPMPSFKEEEQDSGDKTESRASARVHDYRARANEVQVVVKQDEQEEQHDRRVRGLELEAYVSVMKAFYAKGPLTWSKEELLSDLRAQLHISSNDHLEIIRGLKGKKKPAGGPCNGRS